jgi:hypothetical protein
MNMKIRFYSSINNQLLLGLIPLQLIDFSRNKNSAKLLFSFIGFEDIAIFISLVIDYLKMIFFIQELKDAKIIISVDCISKDLAECIRIDFNFDLNIIKTNEDFMDKLEEILEANDMNLDEYCYNNISVTVEFPYVNWISLIEPFNKE